MTTSNVMENSNTATQTQEPPVTEMVERVARALDERIVGGVTMTCGELARVAIAAMREPTEAMLEAAAHEEDKNECGAIYREMIAAALGEGR